MKHIVLHKDSLSILDELTFEEAGKLFKMIYHDTCKDEILDLGRELKLIYIPFKNQFSRDKEKYTNIVETRRIAGKQGGLAKASKSQQELAKPSKASYKKSNRNNKSNNNSIIKDTNVSKKYKSELMDKILKEDFDKFYSNYPRKISRGNAEKAFAKLNADEQQKAIAVVNSDAFKEFMQGQVKNGDDFRPHPATWLNGKRWDDDLKVSDTEEKDEYDLDEFFRRANEGVKNEQ